MQIGTDRMLFLDMMHYVPPNMSLEKFIDSFHPWQLNRSKGVWCYEYIDDFDKLYETDKPPIEAFRSTLKNKDISPEDYQFFCDTWVEQGCESLMDMLKYYNNLDVVPFLRSVRSMYNVFKALGVDMFKGGISLPGVSLQRMFSEQRIDDIVALFDERHKEWHTLFKVRPLLTLCVCTVSPDHGK
jgi:hypothetical protein